MELRIWDFFLSNVFLQLSRKARLGCKVQIIQLPCAEMNVKADQVCQVAGWGRNRTGGENIDDLRVVSVSVINRYVCREQWPGLSASVICAGGYGTDKGFCQVWLLSFHCLCLLVSC